MPNAPAHLLGIIDLRGANIPVVDLRCLLGRGAAGDTGQTRILVVWVAHGAGRAIIGIKTDRVIEVVSEHQPKLVFLLWGSHAQSKQRLIDPTKHLVLRSPHPSPLSAHRGFIGNGHFSRCNQFLSQNGMTPIDWRLPAL